MTNKREVGDELEQYVARLLNMDYTRGSGNQLDDADLKDDRMIIECKVKNNTKGVSVPASQLTKVSRQATKWRRDWGFVTKNSDGRVFITLDLNTFAEIYDNLKSLQEETNNQKGVGKRT